VPARHTTVYKSVCVSRRIGDACLALLN
jgi:hypothetical protein